MIEIKCDFFEFHSDYHVNILGAKNGLVFDSGTHKSHLVAMLQKDLDNDLVYSNKNLVIIQNVSDLSNRLVNSDDCFIVDELNMRPRILEELLQKVREANAYLITIGRISVKQMECSVDAIFALEYDSGQFSVSKVCEVSE